MPLKEMSFQLVLCGFNSEFMRRANQTMPMTQTDVVMDWMTLRPVAVLERVYLSGQVLASRIQPARFKPNLIGRTWKTMTHIVLAESQPLYRKRIVAIQDSL